MSWRSRYSARILKHVGRASVVQCRVEVRGIIQIERNTAADFAAAVERQQGRSEQTGVDGEHGPVEAVHVRLIDIGADNAGVAVQAHVQAIESVGPR